MATSDAECVPIRGISECRNHAFYEQSRNSVASADLKHLAEVAEHSKNLDRGTIYINIIYGDTVPWRFPVQKLMPKFGAKNAVLRRRRNVDSNDCITHTYTVNIVRRQR